MIKKVHTEVVFDMVTGVELSDKFYYYDGDWEKCDEDSDVAQIFHQPDTGPGSPGYWNPSPNTFDEEPEPSSAPPGATVEGVTDLNSALEEFQLRQQGYRSIPLQGGGFTIQPIPDAELDAFLGPDAANRLRSQRQISQLSLSRTEAAFKGNLPVSKGFERDATERRRQIISGLQRGGGVSSSAGIETLGRLRESEDITKEQIRRGEITGGFGRQLSQEQFESQRIAQILGGFQQGRVGATQLGFQQQDMQNQLHIAQLMGQFGEQAGRQQLLGTAIGAAGGIAGSYAGRPPV